ncbi:MAG: MMPL family transporter [Acidobacteriota bacterium]|nr:MMPL family transporter [Acidobacteriota bacterium]
MSPASADRGRLHALGSACSRHPYRVLAVWLVGLIAALGFSHIAGGTYSDNVTLSGTQAYTAGQLLGAHDRAASGYRGLIVMRAPAGVPGQSAPLAQTVSNLSKLPHVLAVTNPLDTAPPTVSADGRIAYSTVQLDVNPKTLAHSYLNSLDRAVQPLRAAGVQVEYGGSLDQLTRPKSSDAAAELIGFVVALAVLLIGFGSLAGAALPLVTALFSVGVGLGLLGIVSAVVTFGTASPTLALMIGLGVGIDYAVFLVTRFRQRMFEGVDPSEAAGECVATSGRAVIVAASTVSVAMFGLYTSGLTFLGQLGFAAVFGVVTAALGAITLVPAAFGFLGRGIDRVTVRKPVAEAGRIDDGWHRYAALVGRRPASFLLLGVVLLGVLAIPLFSIRLGHVDDGADPTTFTDKRAYDLISQGFGPGANATFTVVVDLAAGTSASSAQSIGQHLQQALAATPGVAHAAVPSRTSDGALLVSSLIPTTGPQDAATTSLFNRIVDSTLPAALAGTGARGYVGGSTATYVQFTATLSSRLPVVIAVVVATAFLLIMTAFRSLLLAVKAALLNLLSISAAYGVVVAVFQWGWGRSLIGVSENVPIEAYVPVLMFAIVFGLSMDYEVFLLTRVKEGWDRTRDQHLAVAGGLSSTGRVISCAALIMVSVFTAFVANNEVVIKMLAVGLASSVLIDATVVRLVLVPAVMYLLGRSSWWLPRWLDRVLPHLDIEPSDEPGPAAPAPVTTGATT